METELGRKTNIDPVAVAILVVTFGFSGFVMVRGGPDALKYVPMIVGSVTAFVKQARYDPKVAAIPQPDQRCRRVGCGGRIVVRNRKKSNGGQAFLGCTNYPQCRKTFSMNGESFGNASRLSAIPPAQGDRLARSKVAPLVALSLAVVAMIAVAPTLLDSLPMK